MLPVALHLIRSLKMRSPGEAAYRWKRMLMAIWIAVSKVVSRVAFGPVVLLKLPDVRAVGAG